MKIKVWPTDRDATGHHRGIWPAEAARRAGVDVEIDYVGPQVLWDRDWSQVPEPGLVGAMPVKMDHPGCDVVVITRPRQAHWVRIIELLQAHRVGVVVDIDDDLTAIDRDNIVYQQFNDPQSRLHRRFTDRCCQLADLVTVTTPALAEVYKARGVRTAVLPNLVPAWYLSVPSLDSPQIGWAGVVGVHPRDLQVTGGAVGRIPGHVRVVGTGQGVCAGLELCREHNRPMPIDIADPVQVGGYEPPLCDRVDATGWVDFEHYPIEVAKIGVGIVPLHDSRFNRAKSALKALQYAALGVPIVASPTPDHNRLLLENIRLATASTPAKWTKHLAGLVRMESYRRELAEANRAAAKMHTYGARVHLWAEAWQLAATQTSGVG